jgi:hypothetical protein
VLSRVHPRPDRVGAAETEAAIALPFSCGGYAGDEAVRLRPTSSMRRKLSGPSRGAAPRHLSHAEDVLDPTGVCVGRGGYG